MQAQVFITYTATGEAQKETIHKHDTAAESAKERDTVELCQASLSTQQLFANIDAFPSAIVLQKQPEDHSLG